MIFCKRWKFHQYQQLHYLKMSHDRHNFLFTNAFTVYFVVCHSVLCSNRNQRSCMAKRRSFPSLRLTDRPHPHPSRRTSRMNVPSKIWSFSNTVSFWFNRDTTLCFYQQYYVNSFLINKLYRSCCDWFYCVVLRLPDRLKLIWPKGNPWAEEDVRPAGTPMGKHTHTHVRTPVHSSLSINI